MSTTISYGIDTLNIVNSPSNISNQMFIVNGINIVDTSFNLQLNYTTIPSSTKIEYTITAIRIE